MPKHVWDAAYAAFSEGMGLGVFEKGRLRRALSAALRAAAGVRPPEGGATDVMVEAFITELGYPEQREVVRRCLAAALRASVGAAAAPGEPESEKEIDRRDALRYRFLRDNPLQLRAIDGDASWYDKAPKSFDDAVERAIAQRDSIRESWWRAGATRQTQEDVR